MAKATKTTTGVENTPVVNPEIPTPPAFDFATPPPVDVTDAAPPSPSPVEATPPVDTPPATTEVVPDAKPPVDTPPTPPAKEKVAKPKTAIVTKTFRDKGNFNKVWEVGTDVRHFSKERLDHLIKIGHVELL